MIKAFLFLHFIEFQQYKTKQTKNAILQEHEAVVLVSVRSYGQIAVRHVRMLDMLALLLLQCLSPGQHAHCSFFKCIFKVVQSIVWVSSVVHKQVLLFIYSRQCRTGLLIFSSSSQYLAYELNIEFESVQSDKFSLL